MHTPLFSTPPPPSLALVLVCSVAARQFVTAGIKHLYFWTITGSSLIHKRGITGGDVKMTTMLGVAFGQDDITFSSAMSGDVWMWKKTKVRDGASEGLAACFHEL